MELRYTEGLASILQLLDAQSRRLSAEGQLIGARKERLSNRVRMHVALGGGLETDAVLSPYYMSNPGLISDAKFSSKVISDQVMSKTALKPNSVDQYKVDH